MKTWDTPVERHCSRRFVGSSHNLPARASICKHPRFCWGWGELPLDSRVGQVRGAAKPLSQEQPVPHQSLSRISSLLPATFQALGWAFCPSLSHFPSLGFPGSPPKQDAGLRVGFWGPQTRVVAKAKALIETFLYMSMVSRVETKIDGEK